MAVAYHWEKERRVLSGGSKVGGHRRRATATFCGLQIIYLIANEMCLMSQAAKCNECQCESTANGTKDYPMASESGGPKAYIVAGFGFIIGVTSRKSYKASIKTKRVA